MGKALLALGAIIVVPLLIVVMMYVSYNNQEVRLRNQIVAQQRKNEATFDQTWKIIQQQAGVASEYKDSFRAIYTEIMSARYQDGSAEKGSTQPTLMKWVQEHNPQFDVSLFSKLMTSIEAQRVNFTREQALLLDLKREHDNVLQTLPSSIFVGGRAPIEVKIVTSGKTSKSFETGEDNDVDLFKKGK